MILTARIAAVILSFVVDFLCRFIIEVWHVTVLVCSLGI